MTGAVAMTGPLRVGAGGRVIARRCLLGLAGLAVGWSGAAVAQSRLTADASLSGGVATNPYQQAGPAEAAGSGTVEVTPVYTLETPLTTLRLSGDARLTGYTSRYRRNDSYSVDGAAQHRLSSTVQLNGEVSYVNSVVGSFFDVAPPLGVSETATAVPVTTNPVTPSTFTPLTAPVTSLINDPALAGIGRRRSSYQALVGLDVALNAREELSAQVTGYGIRYPDGAGVDEFNNVSGGVTYQRRLSERSSVGGYLDLSRTIYLRSAFGDATIIQPGLSATRQWSEAWSLTASAGVAVVRLRELTRERTTTSGNGTVSLCRRVVRSSYCFTVSRSTVPSSVQGIRTQTSASASGSYRLGRTATLSGSVSYYHAGAPLIEDDLPEQRGGAVDFVTAAATYSVGIGRRWSAFGTAAIAKNFGDTVVRAANAEVRAGVRYHFGKIK